METFDCFPINGVKVSELTVQRYEPDFNDLSWQTFTVLTSGLLDNPGEDDVIALWFRRMIGHPRVFLPGTVYANPCGVVRAPIADKRFVKCARQLQMEWFHRFQEVLGSADRIRRWMSHAGPIIRQLMHTGVMIIDNRHVFPHQWPDCVKPEEPPTRISRGERFGRLVVLELLSKGQVRCQCDCGTVQIKLRKHLVSGGTKSCGCLQAEREKKLQSRRKDRGWKHTGALSF